MEAYIMECLFCQIPQGQVPAPGGMIYEDDLVCASHYSHSGTPEYLGYVVAQPKRHAKTFADLTDDEARAMGLLIARVARALDVCAGAERSYVEFYGEVTPHLHVFLTARYPNTPPEYWRASIGQWPGAPRGGLDEIAALSARLRGYIAREIRQDGAR
jgi:diadenosine tetraphosphate (Ap4A) HIT family hydrolase